MSETKSSQNFKPSEIEAIDNFLVPMAQNEPDFYKKRITEEEKLAIFTRIYNYNSAVLFATNPGENQHYKYL